MAMSCKVVANRHGYLTFRMYWQGQEFWEGRIAISEDEPHLKDTPVNRKLAEAQALLISREMEKGTFDYLKHFPYGNKAALFRQEQEKTKAIGPQTIRQRWDVWKIDRCPPFVKKTKGRKYKSHFEQHILPIEGDKFLHLYSFADIRELRTRLATKLVPKGPRKGQPLKMKTIENIINATLRAFFRDAKAEGLIAKNPFDDVPEDWWPETVTPAPDPFTEGERDEIIYYFRRYLRERKREPKSARDRRLTLRAWPHAYAFVVCQFWTGMRPSEWTARRWRDYDPRTGKLAIVNGRSEREEGATKTKKSVRIIDMLPPVREALEMIRPLHYRPDDYILKNQAGRPIDQKSFADRHFWPALRALNIRHRDFYATRDTFISVMLSHSEPAKRIAEYCGTSLTQIENSYGKYIQGPAAFGAAALMAGKESERHVI